MTVSHLQCILLSALNLQLAEVETLAQKIRSFLQRLPSLFELLWQHRHVALRTAPSETTDEDKLESVFSAVQLLITAYCTLYRSDCLEMYVQRLDRGIHGLIITFALFLRPSLEPPFSFVVHVGIYCWYHSSDTERSTHGLPSYISPILRGTQMSMRDLACRRNFAMEVIYPALGPSPVKAITRILRKDRWLAGAPLMTVTLDLVMCLCPFIIQDSRDTEVLLTALALVARRHQCQPCYEMVEINDTTGPEHHLLELSRISVAIFDIIRYAPTCFHV